LCGLQSRNVERAMKERGKKGTHANAYTHHLSLKAKSKNDERLGRKEKKKGTWGKKGTGLGLYERASSLRIGGVGESETSNKPKDNKKNQLTKSES